MKHSVLEALLHAWQRGGVEPSWPQVIDHAIAQELAALAALGKTDHEARQQLQTLTLTLTLSPSLTLTLSLTLSLTPTLTLTPKPKPNPNQASSCCRRTSSRPTLSGRRSSR